MNPWLFIHSLWVRDPRDRAHLKALWARDECQRGLMRWLVLLTLPALVWAGVVETRFDLMWSLIVASFALSHIWTCDGALEAEFEWVLPARPQLRLHVLLLGALLPMIVVALGAWAIRFEQVSHVVLPRWKMINYGQDLWIEALFVVVVATINLANFNSFIQYHSLRFVVQFLALALVTFPIFMSFSAAFVLQLLGSCLIIVIALHFSVSRREFPAHVRENFVKVESRNILIVTVFLLLPVGGGAIYYFFKEFFLSIVSEFSIGPLLLPLWTNLLAYLLIRFRVICRRYFYIAALLIIVIALFCRYCQSITNASGGF